MESISRRAQPLARISSVVGAAQENARVNAGSEGPDWPSKVRELQNHHFDSTVWNDFTFRDDDIVIATWGKSGTTWVQQIVGQLLFEGAEDLKTAEISPWLDLRFPPKEEKLAALEVQTHRRFVKTHLPVDALVFSPRARYVYIGRDGRDVVWSQYNHHVSANDEWYRMLNETPGLVGPPIDRPHESILQYWGEWMEKDGYPWWPFWENVRSWWAIKDLPNVCLLHFADLKRDLSGEIRRLAAFLDISVRADKWEDVLRHCSFDYMKVHASRTVPLGGIFWEGGSQTFIHKGTNGRWREVLTEKDIVEYEQRARRELGEACARWLAEGKLY